MDGIRQRVSSVHLVNGYDNSRWILGKMAERLAGGLRAQGVTVTIGEHPSSRADVNHWMVYLHAQGPRLRHSSVGVTHVDDYSKFRHLKHILENAADVAICLSAMTVHYLEERGLRSDQLCYITPGHDGVMVPRRLTIGITSRVYPDGRKREWMLSRLSRMMSLEAFHFQIFGCGWDNVARDLESAGATVECFTGGLGTEADYKEIVRLVPAFDYYLYPGLDEGSLGFLDAVAAGVPTIVTPQGFHLDIPGGITHPFWNFEELAMIFQSLAIKRKEKGRAVAALTWSAYAKRHLAVWELMLTEQPIAVSKLREAGGSSSACNFEHAELYCGWKFHTTAWRRGVSRALSHIRQRMWRASSDVKR